MGRNRVEDTGRVAHQEVTRAGWRVSHLPRNVRATKLAARSQTKQVLGQPAVRGTTVIEVQPSPLVQVGTNPRYPGPALGISTQRRRRFPRRAISLNIAVPDRSSRAARLHLQSKPMGQPTPTPGGINDERCGQRFGCRLHADDAALFHDEPADHRRLPDHDSQLAGSLQKDRIEVGAPSLESEPRPVRILPKGEETFLLVPPDVMSGMTQESGRENSVFYPELPQQRQHPGMQRLARYKARKRGPFDQDDPQSPPGTLDRRRCAGGPRTEDHHVSVARASAGRFSARSHGNPCWPRLGTAEHRHATAGVPWGILSNQNSTLRHAPGGEFAPTKLVRIILGSAKNFHMAEYFTSLLLKAVGSGCTRVPPGRYNSNR